MTAPNTTRSSTDTNDSRSEANYNNEYELSVVPSKCESYDPICKRLDEASRKSKSDQEKERVVCKTSNVQSHLKSAQLKNLKNSTKKLLCLLEDVQAKIHSTALVPDDPPKIAHILRPMAIWDPDGGNMMERSVTDIIGSAAIHRLEKQTQELDSIVIKNKDDDCSVYKRLIRKCHCLNQQEYNDFIIHFNEDTKFCTNTIGEIIKNMLILKKFLYMGGIYTKNALLFLNQGLEEGTYVEKAEIIQACAFADLCCIFDTFTIVTICISWPCSNYNPTEVDSQEMTAKLLYNLSRLEEGRRYLNLNAKITRDIKKVLKKKQHKLSCDTIELLNIVLNTCEPQVQYPGMNSMTFHCRLTQEGIGNKTLNALIAYREHMTLNELFLHLDILQNLSSNEETKVQLTAHLPSILTLFRNMLLELNNGNINILVTKIMNNIVGENIAKKHEKENTIAVGEKITSCIATEPIKMKNVTIQVPVIPVKRKGHKKAQNNRQHTYHTMSAIINTHRKDKEVNKQRRYIGHK